LAGEKEVLGFFVSGHPLDRYADLMTDLGCVPMDEVSSMRGAGKETEIWVAGILSGLQVKRNKRGDAWSVCWLEDQTGRRELLCFAEAYKRLENQLRLTVPVMVKARLLADSEAEVKLQGVEIRDLASQTPSLPRAAFIRVPLDHLVEEQVDRLADLMANRPGSAKIQLHVRSEKGGFDQILDVEAKVTADSFFRRQVEEICGRGSVRVVE
jgi:DNA polymerase-3 subunit alpha